MNSAIDQPRRAELHLDSNTPLVTRFYDDVHLWALHTGTMFDGAQARHMQKVASDIARNLYRGYFGNAVGFDVIALETHHGSR
jgi:hypothetical protein